jgi:hypothetical protein
VDAGAARAKRWLIDADSAGLGKRHATVRGFDVGGPRTGPAVAVPCRARFVLLVRSACADRINAEVQLKIAGTGWRFARYYTRNQAYRMKGTPELVMRMLAPLLVLMTIVLFGSGVAMGLTHGRALEIARRLHGPAAFLWTVIVAVHVLVYLRRAIRSTAADIVPATRRETEGAKARAFILAAVIVGGFVLGAATLPAQRQWLHLPSRHHQDASAPTGGLQPVEKTRAR